MRDPYQPRNTEKPAHTGLLRLTMTMNGLQSRNGHSLAQGSPLPPQGPPAAHLTDHSSPRKAAQCGGFASPASVSGASNLGEVARTFAHHGAHQRAGRCPQNHVQRREEGKAASVDSPFQQSRHQVPPSDDEEGYVHLLTAHRAACCPAGM